MRKLFVSQPMRGKTKDVIFKEREIAVKTVEEYLGEKFDVIDSYIEEHDPNNATLSLGKAIVKMGEADVVCFTDGWEYARGCEVEHLIAESYGFSIIEILPTGKCVIG